MPAAASAGVTTARRTDARATKPSWTAATLVRYPAGPPSTVISVPTAGAVPLPDARTIRVGVPADRLSTRATSSWPV